MHRKCINNSDLSKTINYKIVHKKIFNLKNVLRLHIVSNKLTIIIGAINRKTLFNIYLRVFKDDFLKRLKFFCGI